MKLFKKHYEKIIFIFLLLLFVILFGAQTGSVLSAEKETPEERLRLSHVRDDYKPINFDDKKYKANLMFADVSRRIDPLQESVKKSNWNIDILVPPVLAKCPQEAHFIPITDFPAKEGERNKKCSFCDLQLKDVPLERLGDVDGDGRAKDTDNDGIPDVEETRLGLNPGNERDALEDRDEDGFTNLEEYRAKTDINNPKSRPSYAHKLFVKSVTETKIGIRVIRVSGDRGKGEDTPDKWTVHFVYSVKDKRGNIRSRSMPLRVGRTLKSAGLNGDDFVLEKIEKKFEDNQGQKKNVSLIYLKRVSDGLMHVAKVGDEFFDPKKEVVYEVDLPFVPGKEIKTVIGTEFSIGNETTGVDTFVTTAASKNPNEVKPEDRMKATVKNTKGGADEVIKTRQEVRPDMTMPDMPPPALTPRF